MTRPTHHGSAGFIRANLVRPLEPRGWDVTVLDDPVEHRTGPPGEVRHSCGDPRGLRELFLTLRAGTVYAELERTVRWHELSAAATVPPVAL
ncbi:MAG: hypothetical protein M3R63_13500 [Actinomycetota bacterium]|nr:hypothetical protein [Actinomycetota bacterium]